MKEIWRNIDNYPYQISNKGRVRNNNEDIRSVSIGKNGYEKVVLYNYPNQKTFLIHRLVAIYFIPNPNKLKCVNHKNGIKTDNSIMNLEWCSHKQNSKHAFDYGLMNPPSGESHPAAKVNREKVSIIRKLRGYSQREIAKMFGICQTTVCEILAKKIWKEV